MRSDGGDWMPPQLDAAWEAFRGLSPTEQEAAFRDLYKTSFVLTWSRAWGMCNDPALMVFDTDTLPAA